MQCKVVLSRIDVGKAPGIYAKSSLPRKDAMRTRRRAALDNTSVEVNKNDTINKKVKRGRTDAGNPARKIAGALASEEALHNEKGRTMTNDAAMDAEVLQLSTPESSSRRKKRRSEGADELAKDSAAPARQKKARAAPKDVKAASRQHYEELEEVPDKHQTPQKQAANGGTIDAATAVYQGELSDDNDAPDEVSMAAGKASAAQQRQQEREAAAAKRAAAKAHAEKRTAISAEQKANRDAQRAAKAQHVAGQQHTSSSGQQSEQDEEEDDLLPPEVLDAMMKRSREAERAKLNASAAMPAAANAQRKVEHVAQRKDLSQPHKVGPVYVQILEQVSEPKASAAAKSFAQQRMFGADKKRSAEMLMPTGRGVKAQGRPSAYRGPGLKFV